MAVMFSETILLLFVVNLAPCPSLGAVPEYISDEHRLYKTLMTDYEKWVRPVSHPDQAVNVTFAMTLQGVLEVNEEKGYVSLLTWWNMNWNDIQLQWNRSDYGIRSIRIPSSEVWIPDLAVYNREVCKQDKKRLLCNSSFEGKFSCFSVGDQKILVQPDLVVVSYDGNVTYIPPLVLNAVCKFDFTWYPYDEQTCELKVGSWTHHGNKINLKLFGSNVDTSTFIDHPVWKLQGEVTLRRNVAHYQCCPEPYLDFTATLKIKRESSYTTYIFVTPAVIMAFLIPFLFLFPPQAGEKITLGMGILIGNILVLLIANFIASGAISHPPIIFRYYIANIVLVGISMVASMATVQLWRNGGRASPPKLVSKIFIDGIGCIMCVQRSNYQRQPLTVNAEADAGQSDTAKAGQDVPDVEWKLLSVVLDRMLFLIFLVISVIVATLTVGLYQ